MNPRETCPKVWSDSQTLHACMNYSIREKINLKFVWSSKYNWLIDDPNCNCCSSKKYDRSQLDVIGIPFASKHDGFQSTPFFGVRKYSDPDSSIDNPYGVSASLGQAKNSWTVVLLARYHPAGERFLIYELQNQLAFPRWSSLSG